MNVSGFITPPTVMAIANFFVKGECTFQDAFKEEIDVASQLEAKETLKLMFLTMKAML